jgi:hypothetical protein
MERLARMSVTAGETGVQATSSMLPAESSAPAAGVALEAHPPISGLPADRLPAQVRSRPDVFSQFEAFVLQSFLQAMLPKHADSVFGRGTAGEIWKSMLAEQLASEIARSGRVGIARQIAGGAAEPLAAPPLPEVARASSNPVRPAASLASHLPYLQVRSWDADVGGPRSVAIESAADRS